MCARARVLAWRTQGTGLPTRSTGPCEHSARNAPAPAMAIRGRWLRGSKNGAAALVTSAGHTITPSEVTRPPQRKAPRVATGTGGRAGWLTTFRRGRESSGGRRHRATAPDPQHRRVGVAPPLMCGRLNRRAGPGAARGAGGRRARQRRRGVSTQRRRRGVAGTVPRRGGAGGSASPQRGCTSPAAGGATQTASTTAHITGAARIGKWREIASKPV